MAGLTPQRQNIMFIADAQVKARAAQQLAQGFGIVDPLWLTRRGVNVGWIGEVKRPTMPALSDIRARWQDARPTLLGGFLVNEVCVHQEAIEQSLKLMKQVLKGKDCADIFSAQPYAASLAPHFELLSSFFDESDTQEIVTVEFDAIANDAVLMENLWVKLSWLSYEKNDTSLRFRFSQGLQGFDEVQQDPLGPGWAAQLTEAIFPECAVVTNNLRVQNMLKSVLGIEQAEFVERIIYFNAPGGGALFHQDVERGHLGVVFAQLHGRTGWLTLSKQALIAEVQAFLVHPHADRVLKRMSKLDQEKLRLETQSSKRLSAYLEDCDNEPLMMLLNHTPEFTRFLIERGHGFILYPGDVLLLPQHDAEHCAWHSVYCLDEFAGHALSFAVRSKE